MNEIIHPLQDGQWTAYRYHPIHGRECYAEKGVWVSSVVPDWKVPAEERNYQLTWAEEDVNDD